ncbi:hypothetical protein GN156_02380 [bacterium LRH843]|nr:hypothetical protein [bacterium LRH843]
MLSVVMLTIICGSVLPILIIVYQERVTIQEKVDALYQLEQWTHHYIAGNENQVNKDIDVLVRKEKISEHVMRFCSKWPAKNGREYEYCLLASK